MVHDSISTMSTGQVVAVPGRDVQSPARSAGPGDRHVDHPRLQPRVGVARGLWHEGCSSTENVTGHEGPTRAGTPQNTFVLDVGPAVMSTIPLTMMFLEDNSNSAVLDVGTEKALQT